MDSYFWLILTATLVAMLARRLKLPYAIALVLTGLAIGAPRLLPRAHLDPHTLFTVFLPPLLFEAAIQLRTESLMRRWRTIALLAGLGTALSTLVVAGLSTWLLGLPLAAALVFGALTAPTDPISVIAVFKRLGVAKRLSLLVEAESLFNDGVAVVLFGVLSSSAVGHAATFLEGARQFGVVVLGGAAVGAAIGWTASRATHAFDDHLLEIMLTTLAAFGSYLGAEAVHVSGVIAVVVAGLFVGNLGMQSGMSPTTRLAVASFWEYAAFAANSLVFLLLGIEVTVVNLWGHSLPVLVAALVVLCGRAAAVYLLTPPAAHLEGPIPCPWRHVLFWGGLRGALSMALAMGLPPEFPQRDRLVILTFGVVVLSLLLQGLSIGALLQRLGLCGTSRALVEFHHLMAERLACEGGLRELDRWLGSGQAAVGGETVRQEYLTRLERVRSAMHDLHLSDEELQRRHGAALRRKALLGEKSALQEAMRSGLAAEEAAQPILERVDAELAELQARLGGE